MSEHRRKPPQSQGGGRAAGRRAAQQRPGRRDAAGRDVPTGSPSAPYGQAPYGQQGYGQAPYGQTGHDQGGYSPGAVQGGRAEARRAAQRGAGGRRRGAEPQGRGGAAAKDRFINYPRADKDGWQRFVPSWKLVGGTALGFTALLTAGAGIALAVVGTPNEKDAAKAQNNVYYWADKEQMAAVGGEMNRQIIPIEKIPLSLQNAVIAAENASFDTDKGVDPMGIGRAVFNMMTGGETQGGSTITQQFVKNTYLDSDQTMKRKVAELFISIKVGATKKKPEIMQGYLNTAYFGRNAYGCQAASQAYFKKDCQEIDPSESAFLAQLLKGPNLYNPDGGIGKAATPEANEARAKQRWAWVLDREVEVGRMTPEERAKYTTFPKLQPSEQALALTGQTGYLVETAKQYVMKKLDLKPEDLDRGGYRIYTTFQKPKVDALAKAVDKTRDEFLDEKSRPKTDRFVQFGAASVDPKSGAIVALYGGAGYDKKHFSNNANTIGVPVGSTWKPYVLAAAMEYGTSNSDGEGISVDSKYNGDDLTVIKNRNGEPLRYADGRPFRQKNESPTKYGYVTLNEAMEKSINTPFAQLVFDVGHDKVRKVAEATGILKDSMDPNDNASFALGTSTPSAIRMADSYATFAASGTHYEPFSVTKVLKNGVEQPGFEAPAAEKAMDNSIADNVTKVLQNVVENGTGTKVKKLGRPAAGKTGTTDKNKSAWFVGYTPQLSTAVTLFRTDPNSKDKELISMNGTGDVPSIHGGDIPAEIWVNYMKDAVKGVPVKDFPEAEEIGVDADALGAPTPTPTAKATKTVEPTPSATTKSPKPTPTPTKGGKPTCKPWQWDCNTDGGTDSGTTAGNDTGGTSDGGVSGGTTPTPTPTDTLKPGGRNGGTNSGLIGGSGDG
ncbi:penicillin-binding protein [Streptomyces bambusae]|uniref:transglycosylase domain-containing protein n=1 Tax=Streptomyces bambusae TaxID=1550616 RepID=UPI001CFE0276|nr:transglycosylase domain-containing protein [Streptomyces bambusae]MCB5163312.1 penicillin-binding protein [Streptomyces bambusae]